MSSGEEQSGIHLFHLDQVLTRLLQTPELSATDTIVTPRQSRSMINKIIHQVEIPK
jgi:mannosyltransferase OCH1-like enzyme